MFRVFAFSASCVWLCFFSTFLHAENSEDPRWFILDIPVNGQLDHHFSSNFGASCNQLLTLLQPPGRSLNGYELYEVHGPQWHTIEGTNSGWYSGSCEYQHMEYPQIKALHELTLGKGKCRDGRVWSAAAKACVNVQDPDDCDESGPTNKPILAGLGFKAKAQKDFVESAAFPLSIERNYLFDTKKGRWRFQSMPIMRTLTVTAYSYFEGTYFYNSIIVQKSNGGELIFTGDDTAGYTLENGSTEATLERRYSGSTPIGWKVIYANNTVEIYSGGDFDVIEPAYDAVLIMRQSANGLSHTYTPGTNSLTITNDQTGTTLTYNYDTEGKVTSAVVSGVGTFSYAYDATTGMLTSVTYPDLTTVTYHYEEANFPEALTGITDERGVRVETYDYNDTEGYAISSELSGGVESSLVTYTWNYGKVDQANITNALGRTTSVYFTELANGQRKISKVAGHAHTVSSCMASNSENVYDNDGYKVAVTKGIGANETDYPGNVTYYARNDATRDHLVTEVQRGLRWPAGYTNTQRIFTNVGNLEANTASQKVQTDWHLSANLPTEKRYYGYASGSSWAHYKTVQFTYDDGTVGCAEDENANPLPDPAYRVCSRKVIDETGQSVSPDDEREWQYDYVMFNGTNIVKTRTVTAPDNTQTVQTYNSAGQLTSSQNAALQTTTYGNYNSFGKPELVTDPNGVHTKMCYDMRGRLVTSVIKAGSSNLLCTDIDDGQVDRITLRDYYDNGLLEKVTQPDGAWVKYTYNNAGHMTFVENSTGDKMQLTPSPINGEWEAIVITCSRTGEPCNSGTSVVEFKDRVIDGAGRVSVIKSSKIPANSQMMGYDPANNLYSQILVGDYTTLLTPGDDYDDDDIAIIYEYDAQNRLTKTIGGFGCVMGNCTVDAYNLFSGTVPAGPGTEITYNDQGRQATVTDANGLVTSYTYNGFGETVEVNSPDSGITEYEYDVLGRLVQKTNANNVVTKYTYDNLGRQKTIDYGDNGVDITYYYDGDQTSGTYNHGTAIGRLTSVSDLSGLTHYEYDAVGNMIESHFTPTGSSTAITTGYTYNLANVQTSVTYNGVHTINYDYTFAGNGMLDRIDLDGTQDLIYTSAWWPFKGISQYDRLMDMTQPELLTTTRSYNQEGQLSNINHALYSNPADDMDADFVYDAFGNIHTISDDLTSQTAAQTFRYDEQQRLVDAEGIYGIYTYTYDDIGNRLTRKLERREVNNPATKHTVFTENYYYEATGNTETNNPAAFVSNRLKKIEREDSGNNKERERLYVQDAAGNTTTDTRKFYDTGGSTPDRVEKVEPAYGDHNRMSGVTGSTIDCVANSSHADCQ